MERVPVATFLAAPGIILDVRSPAEFTRGHIRDAYSFPIFSDHERAVIGILYKMAGREAAYQKGLEIVGPKLQRLVASAKTLSKGNKALRIYCWRGGKRSESMAWLLGQAGHTPCVLDGGYKAFRRWVLEWFEQWNVPLYVIGGYTGSGKTAVLDVLSRMGEPVLDLEKIAQHRGSAFGHLGRSPQPTQQQFENDLALTLWALRSAPYVWVEDESRSIGRCLLPASLYTRIRSAPLVFIDVPSTHRISRLVMEYGQYPIDQLRRSFFKIRKRLGPQRYAQALRALSQNDIPQAASIALEYYDKTYMYGLSCRAAERIHILQLSGSHFTPKKIAQQLREYVHAQRRIRS